MKLTSQIHAHFGHKKHFPRVKVLWATALVLLSSGASTVSFKGIIVNCSDRFPALCDLLLCDLLSCCSPCASQVLADRQGAAPRLHSPLPRRKGDAPWIQRGFFCTAAGDHRLPGRRNPLTPPHSLQQLKEGPSPNKSLKWKCESVQWKRHSCTPPTLCTQKTQKSPQKKKKRIKYF